MMQLISDLMVPSVLVIIIMHGYLNKQEIFDSFIEGAKDGFSTVLHIMPTILGLMISVGILRASGALDLLTYALTPLANLINYPAETIPLTFMRLVSSSASTGLILDIFQTHGPDSFIGRFVSIMMSCTETVFYTMSIYFMSVKITRTRYTITGALIANFAGVMASLFITEYVFGR